MVRPGGRVVITLPYAAGPRGMARRPVYGDEGEVGGRYFFERWYDEERVAQLVGSVPALEPISRRVSRLWPAGTGPTRVTFRGRWRSVLSTGCSPGAWRARPVT